MDEHIKYEFATRDTEDTLQTMVSDAYVKFPVLTGGVGRDELREFYDAFHSANAARHKHNARLTHHRRRPHS